MKANPRSNRKNCHLRVLAIERLERRELLAADVVAADLADRLSNIAQTARMVEFDVEQLESRIDQTEPIREQVFRAVSSVIAEKVRAAVDGPTPEFVVPAISASILARQELSPPLEFADLNELPFFPIPQIQSRRELFEQLEMRVRGAILAQAPFHLDTPAVFRSALVPEELVPPSFGLLEFINASTSRQPSNEAHHPEPLDELLPAFASRQVEFATPSVLRDSRAMESRSQFTIGFHQHDGLLDALDTLSINRVRSHRPMSTKVAGLAPEDLEEFSSEATGGDEATWPLYRFWGAATPAAGGEVPTQDASSPPSSEIAEADFRRIDLVFADNLAVEGMVSIESLDDFVELDKSVAADQNLVDDSVIEIDRVAGRFQAFDVAVYGLANESTPTRVPAPTISETRQAAGKYSGTAAPPAPEEPSQPNVSPTAVAPATLLLSLLLSRPFRRCAAQFSGAHARSLECIKTSSVKHLKALSLFRKEPRNL
jgi:hypothetical protein